MTSNLTSVTAENTLISGSAPQITSTNTAGIRTKEMNISLKISVIVPSGNIPRASYKYKNQTQEARLFCCHMPFSSEKIVQCTLHGPVYTAILCQAFLQCTQNIFVYSDIKIVYSGIFIDLENRYRLDSVLYIEKCTLQYCIRLLIGYMRQCNQFIYSVLLHGVLNVLIVYSCMVSVYSCIYIYQGF